MSSSLAWNDGKWGGNEPVGEFFEPILALRLWQLRAYTLYSGSKTYKLYSTSKACIRWDPGVPLEAECLAPLFSCNMRPRCLGPVPRATKACGCGIYGIKDPGGVALVRAAYAHPFRGPLALGIVKLWGRVLEGRLGYRAQFGYPAALAFSEGDEEERSWVEQAAETYRVPLYPPDELPLDGIEKRGVLKRLKEIVS